MVSNWYFQAYVIRHNRFGCPLKNTALALMYFLVPFHAVKWDAVGLMTVTSRGFEELQQETLADLSSPALWNCRAVPLQSCIIAESVAKEPVAHAFSWKCWRKSEYKLQLLQNEFPLLLRFPCWLIRPLHDDDMTTTMLVLCIISFFITLFLLQWLIFSVLLGLWFANSYWNYK